MNSINFANAQRAKAIYNYKKGKIYNTSASIWFNKVRKTKRPTLE
jgi:hypothetical protein